jgi:hypothetical protein
MFQWRVWVVLIVGLSLGVGQEVVNVPETDCVNGELVDSDNSTAMSCQCDPGWTGPACSLCRGRVR